MILQPVDVAKLELLNAPAVPNNNPDRKESSVATLLMSSGTVASWPAHHNPTPDGGQKGVKKGRVNHFQAGAAGAGAGAALPNSLNQLEELSLESEKSIDWLGITRDEYTKLKRIRVPAKELHLLFMCIAILLKRNDFSWAGCRDILLTKQLSAKLRRLTPQSLSKDQVASIRTVFQEPNFNQNTLLRISVASAKMFGWLQKLMDAYDDVNMGLGDSASSLLVMTSPSVTPRSPRTMMMPRPPPEKEPQTFAQDEIHVPVRPKPTIVDKGRLIAE